MHPNVAASSQALRRYDLQNTPEANDLARNALEANIAHERALFAGNRDEGMRQRRLARDLSSAVRMLASADHPEAFPQPRQMRRPMSPPGAPGTPGTRQPMRAGLGADAVPETAVVASDVDMSSIEDEVTSF